jgi:hypothetical protein
MGNNMEMESFLILKLEFGEREDGSLGRKLCFMNKDGGFFFLSFFL